ncbi:uncharacterized protein RHIMIDRAFT_255405 [Rhizopus microsporus ATCC 52813]|uniref:Uncharacterized protein n=1 Tax=Rhizopus microsporus ATCC 52813 TaxID=1340429 RepID=A0A2G4TAL3_RHIZD|nr:uncharacterized protein RHIMIDRAFT_255405 [Rhizopus microsporus ATCC 52813]PHZ18033.1 hypothetical protein RHIMIDRAFT_255405 [Rhizopus microsporus ATCC 52813]
MYHISYLVLSLHCTFDYHALWPDEAAVRVTQHIKRIHAENASLQKLRSSSET